MLRDPEMVGFVAGFGTTFAALPDLVMMLRQQSCRGTHPRMAAIMCLFQLVWIYYGVLIASRPIVGWNVVAVGINAASVGTYLYFRRKEAKTPGG